MKINFHSKKLLVAAFVIAVFTGVGVSAFSDSQSTGASEEPPIVKEVAHQGERLDNHEARITNVEGDVKEVQDKTGVAPTNTRVEVPVPSPAPKPSPAVTPPAPVVVTAYEQIPTDQPRFIDCKVTYSDGTTHQWHWQTINPQGAWVTDGVGNNGHYQETTNHENFCDNRMIGVEKT